MKTVMAMFAMSFAAALVVAASTARAAPAPEDTMVCPPNTYDCCDETSIGTKEFCATHGGTCGIETICGKPV